MKRVSMKSTYVPESKCRPEGRLFPRRRVAVKSHLLNGVGDFEMELSLAIQESLKYAQQAKEDEKKEKDNTNSISNKGIENKQNLFAIQNGRHDQSQALHVANHKTAPSSVLQVPMPISASMDSTDWASEEVGRLKDLLLSQAELIQCLQNEVADKDKEIKDLTAARDTLQCRLERTERRMAVLRHREETRDTSGSSSAEHLPRAVTSLGNSGHQKRLVEITTPEAKVSRRKAHRQNDNHKNSKRQKLVKTNTGTDVESEKEEGSEEDEVSSSESQPASDEENQEEVEDSDTQKEEIDLSQEVQEEEKIIDYPIMQTDTLYHLYYPKNSCPSPEAKNIQEQTEVETPCWRLKPMTNMYQLEGTENITDEAYFKRHQKYELEEKRRKRWDLQRLRELRLSEKLQRQREDEIRASQDEVDMETFLPSVHDLKYIEKTDLIPVMAFGQPIPYVSPAEFEIPWESSHSEPAPPVGRQRANSIHSKKL